MNDLEKKIRERFLDRLGEWDCTHPRELFGMAALPYFVKAFEQEPEARRRERLIEIIWEFRASRNALKFLNYKFRLF